MTLPGECGGLAWRSWHAPSEEPTAKHMKTSSKKPRFSSLRQFSWSGKKDKSVDEELIESTVLEWYEQKHGKPSPEETAFVKLDRGEVVPTLRPRRRRQGRKGPERDPALRLPRMRKAIHAPHRHDIRLEEDTDIGMDRVPGPPLRVPFPEDVHVRQQERENHRRLLAFQGLHRAQGSAGRRRPQGPRLRRREALRRAQLGQGEGEGEGKVREFQGVPVLRCDGHQRRARLLPRHGEVKATRTRLHEDLW